MKLLVQCSLCDSVLEEVIRLKNTAHWMHTVFAVCARVFTAQCAKDGRYCDKRLFDHTHNNNLINRQCCLMRTLTKILRHWKGHSFGGSYF